MSRLKELLMVGLLAHLKTGVTKKVPHFCLLI